MSKPANQQENLVSSKTVKWKSYTRKGITEMRQYIEGEDLTGVSISSEDKAVVGAMIARNPNNHNDKWMVAESWFEDNYEPAPEQEPQSDEDNHVCGDPNSPCDMLCMERAEEDKRRELFKEMFEGGVPIEFLSAVTLTLPEEPNAPEKPDSSDAEIGAFLQSEIKAMCEAAGVDMSATPPMMYPEAIVQAFRNLSKKAEPAPEQYKNDCQHEWTYGGKNTSCVKCGIRSADIKPAPEQESVKCKRCGLKIKLHDHTNERDVHIWIDGNGHTTCPSTGGRHTPEEPRDTAKVRHSGKGSVTVSNAEQAEEKKCGSWINVPSTEQNTSTFNSNIDLQQQHRREIIRTVRDVLDYWLVDMEGTNEEV